MSELSVRDEEIEQLRQEITLIRNSNEQRFHEYNVETRRLITEAENEKNKAISESKAAKEALDKLHMDLAFLEKSLQEEKEDRLKLLSLTHEKILPKDNEDQIKILHSQYQKHMSELQNELQIVKMNENQLKDQLSIITTEKESLRDQLNSTEKDLKQWQNLTKSTSESKV
ncbi:6461_t:CDS:2 [Diversispora eburnea]|uniref:6461_t:CDS:1 n=1 Tax=Diversispora eburnea TaxID=1213867 RepID=A0A9N9FDP7_9GLOM|nr:6461_t:CDS:2 [Diversispora eburnea]